MILELVKIYTDRLTLEPISQKYAEEIFKEFTDEITKYMFPPTPKNISETQEFILSAMEKIRNDVDLVTVILDKETGEFFGCAGLHRLNTKTPELGVWIKVSAHGKKIGREAVTGLKNWADKNLKYDHIVYPVAKENVASRKIPESLGGVIDHEVVKTTPSGKILNEVVYYIPRLPGN